MKPGDEDDRHLHPGHRGNQPDGGGQRVGGGDAGDAEDGAAEQADRTAGESLVHLRMRRLLVVRRRRPVVDAGPRRPETSQTSQK